MSLSELKKTPLYATHMKYGGRMVEFGGWSLPVQFSGIKEEHLAVRSAAGLFDVSHMGEITLDGLDALALAQKVTCNDLSKGFPGRVIYSPMCNERGGVVDDILVCFREDGGLMLVVNASNTDKDFEWITRQAAGMKVRVTNISLEVGELALQGPNSEAILQRLTSFDLSGLKYYRMKENVDVGGIKCTISRTGYTGEDGFELYCRPEDAPSLWEAIMDAGYDLGLMPCGLGARDTLRFEAGMPLYGHELDDERTPVEAGLERFVSFSEAKGDYIGRDALYRQKVEGPAMRLVGFEMVDRGVPRNGYPVTDGARKVGYVTSGTYCPTFDANLGMAYVPRESAALGTELFVEVRGKALRIRTRPLPFYKRGAR